MFGWIHKCFSAIIFQIQTQFSASFVDLLRLLTLRLHKYVFQLTSFFDMLVNKILQRSPGGLVVARLLTMPRVRGLIPANSTIYF